MRLWLIENGFQGKEGQKLPEISDNKIKEISDRYIELYELITGEKFIKANTNDILKRVENNITSFLNE